MSVRSTVPVASSTGTCNFVHAGCERLSSVVRECALVLGVSLRSRRSSVERLLQRRQACEIRRDGVGGGWAVYRRPSL